MTKIKSNVGSILLLQYQMFSMHLFSDLVISKQLHIIIIAVLLSRMMMPNNLQIVGETEGFSSRLCCQDT